MTIELMTIEEEIERLIQFLSHPAGFNANMAGLLTIRPTDEGCPPTYWAVDWEDQQDGMTLEYEKEFSSLQEAAQFFVEKRRYMCLGLDFESIYLGAETASVEINQDE